METTDKPDGIIAHREYEPTEFFASRYEVSAKWVRRFAKECGMVGMMRDREWHWPTEQFLAAFAALNPGRLARLQARHRVSPCRPKRLSAPEGFLTARQLWERNLDIDLETLLKTLAYSDVTRAKIAHHRVLAYKAEEAQAHVDAYRIKQQKLEEAKQIWQDKLRSGAVQPRIYERRPNLLVEPQKPLLKLPPLDKFREVVREYERTNPWR